MRCDIIRLTLVPSFILLWLVLQFRQVIPFESITGIFEAILTLLASKSREIVKSVLGFVKMCSFVALSSHLKDYLQQSMFVFESFIQSRLFFLLASIFPSI